jgi:DNA-directed RNA polymerase subunit RPC12/RpoP
MSEIIKCPYCNRRIKPYPIIRNEICFGKICPGCGHEVTEEANKEVENER